MSKTLKEAIEEILLCIDELALETFEPGTKEYEFQQFNIKIAARYRMMKEKENK
jgi:hypothetical protein